MKAYRRMYPEPTTIETLTINGYEVVREVSAGSEEARVIRYIFQDPTDNSLRLTLIDNISGFPARAQDNEATIQIIEAIIKSFSFD